MLCRRVLSAQFFEQGFGLLSSVECGYVIDCTAVPMSTSGLLGHWRTEHFMLESPRCVGYPERLSARKGYGVITGILFDFFGTLVAYSASRVAQGYDATYNLLRDNGVDLSYAAFLESWVAVSEALDHWSQRMECEYSMEQVATHFLSRVCPHHRSHTLPTQLWMSYVKEWSVTIRYIPGVRSPRRVIGAFSPWRRHQHP